MSSSCRHHPRRRTQAHSRARAPFRPGDKRGFPGFFFVFGRSGQKKHQGGDSPPCGAFVLIAREYPIPASGLTRGSLLGDGG
eukprot:CAMPEP_0113598274 /NCGR_PEP_ID=MMETSP0015_2-20120614/41485_1 /TAXON_ID=2838 /ORGANISM="Odontella" /LENGTH=81 /DNA_ID=CAMNT_0000506251 /DNA_START=17 /DNA_END=258 /DNA_ORIENTATION=- /assembly_acc=CAM_ASM_000160